MAIQLKKGFVLRKIGAQYMAVPFGAMTREVKGMVSLTESGYFLWQAIENGTDSVEALADLLTAEYEVDGTYWAFYVGNSYGMTGVDMTEIEPGATYAFKVSK